MTPEIEDEALRVTLRVVHVKAAGTAIVTFGFEMFWITFTEAVDVQPFTGLVTVTECVPEVETVFVVPVPPPLQLYVTPDVGEEALSVTLLLVQVKTPVAGTETFAPGETIF